MIESKIIKAILNNDHHEAYEAWLLNEEKCRELISKSRLKNNFLRLLGLNNKFQNNGLQEFLEREQLRHELKTNFAIEFSEALERAKVNHAIIKGPAISSIYYDNQCDRKFSDIDILISLHDQNRFYKFLNDNCLNHKNNIKFIKRIGYTRTALEVIDTGEHVVDFHHRILSKFHKSVCILTNDMLCNVQNSHGIRHTSHELNLAVIIYHACVHNSYKLDPYYLVDFDRVNNYSKLDKNKMPEILDKYNLYKHYQYCSDLIKKIRSDTLNKKDSKKLFSTFQYMKPNSIKSQLYQIIDPTPYMNIKADKRNFTYFDFLRTKFKILTKKLRQNLFWQHK